MKIIIIALVLGVLMGSGCVVTPDHTGTYANLGGTITLFDDGSFTMRDSDSGVSLSGEYKITDDTIHLMHPLMGVALHINETGIYDPDGSAWVKQ